jgi:ABC-2 type transport system ATP-binding protein
MSSKKSAIHVSHLVKKYSKATTPAVDDVSFTVEPGEFFSLLGPNGAGKTTTISILTTTLSPTSGVVEVAGFDVSESSHDVRKNVGIIFQNPSLDSRLTAEENIRFHACLYNLYPYRPTFNLMPIAYQKQILELTGILGLTPSDLKKPVSSLSGGMKRKLEIVRSLMHRPKVLFLDEPTSGLDPKSRRDLWDYLSNIRKQDHTTIFLTTHYLEEAEGSDRVCIINHGKVVAIGSPSKLKKDFSGKGSSLEDAYLKIIASESQY